MSQQPESGRARPIADEQDGLSGLAWLWAHIGVISGLVLGLCVLGFLAFLAIVGYGPALTFIISIVGFFGLIALGGRFQRR